jgi:choline dehydrogenase-like flavoprotein
VVVVGAGAAGGWAAKELTERGLRVALVEAGPRVPEPGGGGLERRPVQSSSYACTEESAQLFVDDLDNPYEVTGGGDYRWIRSRQVGGRLHVWGRTSPRMGDDELKAASRDGVGEDWPISAADLAPFYARAEELLEVSRTPLVAGERAFKEVVETRWPGRTVVPTPHACEDPNRALQGALSGGRLTVLADTIAERVLVAAGGERVSGVAVVDRRTGSRHEVGARAVVLCASALESTRLLLGSATADHPDGLANSSGALGRYLMDHTYGIYFEGLAPPRAGHEYEPSGNGAFISGFRNVTEPSADFLRGYGIEMAVETRWVRFGRLRRGVQDRFWMGTFGEVLPDRGNGVELDRARLDAWGIPTLRIHARYGENELAMARDQVATLREMLAATGFEASQEVTELAPPGASAHEMGTARMGADPATSVLNSYNQAWDVPNLFLTDAASFTSSGHRNPTLTIMALTARASRYLGDQLRAGDL